MSLLDLGAGARAEAGEEPPAAASPARGLVWAQYAALGLAVFIWGRLVTGRAGGRDEGALVWGCLSLLPAVLLLRPALRQVLPQVGLVLAALTVCLLTPYAFSNTAALCTAAYSGAALALVLAFATTSERRRVLACALVLVSLDQFSQGFLAWWGGRDVYRAMVGTFYWHNQFAAFLLPGLVLGGALAVFGHRIERLIGFISSPVCAAGLLFSASRATMLMGALGGLGLLISAAAGHDRKRRLGAGALLVATWIGAVYFFSSSIFFPEVKDPFGTSPVRAQQELSTSAHDRLNFWQAALDETAERPWVGGGFGSFGERSTVHIPIGSERASSAHNEVLDAFAQGGLLWGLPVLAVVLGLALAAARRVLAHLSRLGPDRAVSIGAGLSLLAMLGHAGVDFDWSYPSLAVAAGLMGGLVLAVPRARAPQPATRPRRLPATALLVAVLVLATQVAHASDRQERAITGVNQRIVQNGPVAAARAVTDTRSWFFNPRLDAALLDIALARGVGSVTLPSSTVRGALDRLDRFGSINDDVNARRAAVLFGLGRRDEALRLERGMALQRAHHRPVTLQAYALLLWANDEGVRARDLLAGTIVLRGTHEARTNRPLGQQLYTLYLQLAEIAPGSRELRCAGSALEGLPLIGKPGAGPLLHATASDRCAALREKGWP